jgi:hypothetical protein
MGCSQRAHLDIFEFSGVRARTDPLARVTAPGKVYCMGYSPWQWYCPRHGLLPLARVTRHDMNLGR